MGGDQDSGRRVDSGRNDTYEEVRRKEERRDSGSRLGAYQICSKADRAAASFQTSLLSDATKENNYDVR